MRTISGAAPTTARYVRARSRARQVRGDDVREAGLLRRGVLVASLTLLGLVLASCSDPMSTIDVQGDHAQIVLDVYELVFWLAAVVFVAVLVATIVFSFAFKEKPGRVAKQIHGNTRLEVVWTLIPVVIVIVISVPTFDAISKTAGSDAPDGALQVTAVGHQWWFEFEYPELGITTANELHIPVDRAVDFTLLSEDVIHSFWVPRLAGKVDMVPGHENRLWFTAKEARDEPFLGQCAEYCGTSHANMRFRVFVHSQADFEAWAANEAAERRAPSDELTTRGEEVFLSQACIGCHAIGGTTAGGLIGPNLTHVGNRTTLASGIIANTPENMAEGIRDSGSVKPGSLMPSFPALSDEDLQALVAYLQSLE